MKTEIEITEVQPLQFAAIRAETKFEELKNIIPKLLDEVYDFLKASSIREFGHNAVLYLDMIPTIEAGVIMKSDFKPSGKIIISTLPGGRVLKAIHTGPYENLPQTHSVVHSWAKENKVTFSGLCWEIYLDPNDDPEKLETEVYYLLK